MTTQAASTKTCHTGKLLLSTPIKNRAYKYLKIFLDNLKIPFFTVTVKLVSYSMSGYNYDSEQGAESDV